MNSRGIVPRNALIISNKTGYIFQQVLTLYQPVAQLQTDIFQLPWQYSAKQEALQVATTLKEIRAAALALDQVIVVSSLEIPNIGDTLLAEILAKGRQNRHISLPLLSKGQLLIMLQYRCQIISILELTRLIRRQLCLGIRWKE